MNGDNNDNIQQEKTIWEKIVTKFLDFFKLEGTSSLTCCCRPNNNEAEQELVAEENDNVNDNKSEKKLETNNIKKIEEFGQKISENEGDTDDPICELEDNVNSLPNSGIQVNNEKKKKNVYVIKTVDKIKKNFSFSVQKDKKTKTETKIKIQYDYQQKLKEFCKDNLNILDEMTFCIMFEDKKGKNMKMFFDDNWLKFLATKDPSNKNDREEICGKLEQSSVLLTKDRGVFIKDEKQDKKATPFIDLSYTCFEPILDNANLFFQYVTDKDKKFLDVSLIVQHVDKKSNKYPFFTSLIKFAKQECKKRGLKNNFNKKPLTKKKQQINPINKKTRINLGLSSKNKTLGVKK